MREIKFRTWNTKLKIFGGNIIINSYGVKAPTMQYADVKARDDHYKLMQYTGLRDKNGKEIYEGDILTASLKDFTGKWTVEIGWSTDDEYGILLCSLLRDTKNVVRKVDGIDRTFEVIGNIYENKELLK